MKIKIIAIALTLVLLAFSFAACGKNKGFTKTDGKIEYTTDENGDLFVTNVNGEMIPVTTDENGFGELYEDLITKTSAQVDKEKESISESQNNGATNGGGNQDSGNSGGNQNGTTTDPDFDPSKNAVIDFRK